jgi:hypothetical protein
MCESSWKNQLVWATQKLGAFTLKKLRIRYYYYVGAEVLRCVTITHTINEVGSSKSRDGEKSSTQFTDEVIYT